MLFIACTKRVREPGYTHERFAQDMYAVADQERVDQLVLVGVSMAGKVAQYMPYLTPQRVLGQILISPVAAAPYGAPNEVLMQWCDAAPYPERFREIGQSFIKVPPKPELVDLYCATVAQTPRAALEATMHMFNDESIVEEVKQNGESCTCHV